MNKRIIGYARCSVESQHTSGHSIEVQVEQIKNYCSLYNLTLVEVFIDAGKSGKNLNRQSLKNALEMLNRDDIEGLLVSKLDRLSRNTRDLLNMVDNNFATKDLISIHERLDTSTAMGRFALTLIGSVSELERGMIGERTKTALQHLKAQGKRVGGRGAPYGKAVLKDGTLVNCAPEMATIRKARRLRATGLSLRKISERLAAKGSVSRNGKPFQANQVRLMLR